MSLKVPHERVPVSRTLHSNLSVTFPHSERSFQVHRRAQFAVVIAAYATRLEKAIPNYAKRRWIAAGHHCRGSGTGAPWRRLVALFEAKTRPNHAHDLTAIGFAPGTIFASNCVAQHADVPSLGKRRSRSSRRQLIGYVEDGGSNSLTSPPLATNGGARTPYSWSVFAYADLLAAWPISATSSLTVSFVL
jgi:hypothetical protein